MRSLFFLLSVAAMALGACGSEIKATSSTTGGGGKGSGGSGPIAMCSFGKDPSAAGVCADMACVACQGRQTCDPFGFARTWRTLDECIQRTVSLCDKQVQAPHVKAPLASFEACAKDTSALQCGDFLAGQLPASCALTGDAAQGAPCGVDAQCATGACLKDFPDSACGLCAPPQAGTTCNGQGVSCGPALFCYAGQCTARGRIGDACMTTLTCADGVCSQGHCIAPRAEGAACKGSPDNDCDPRHGLACDEMSLTCAKIPVNTGGGACGQLTGTVQTACGPGFTCIVHDSPPGGCEANPTDGMSCAQPDPTASAKKCAPPAICNMANVCELPDPASCQ